MIMTNERDASQEKNHGIPAAENQGFRHPTRRRNSPEPRESDLCFPLAKRRIPRKPLHNPREGYRQEAECGPPFGKREGQGPSSKPMRSRANRKTRNISCRNYSAKGGEHVRLSSVLQFRLVTLECKQSKKYVLSVP